jgi:hypothetical protein
MSEGEWGASFCLEEDVSFVLAYCFGGAEQFASPVEVEGDLDVAQQFTTTLAVEHHIVEFSGK